MWGKTVKKEAVIPDFNQGKVLHQAESMALFLGHGWVCFSFYIYR